MNAVTLWIKNRIDLVYDEDVIDTLWKLYDAKETVCNILHEDYNNADYEFLKMYAEGLFYTLRRNLK